MQEMNEMTKTTNIMQISHKLKSYTIVIETLICGRRTKKSKRNRMKRWEKCATKLMKLEIWIYMKMCVCAIEIFVHHDLFYSWCVRDHQQQFTISEREKEFYVNDAEWCQLNTIRLQLIEFENSFCWLFLWVCSRLVIYYTIFLVNFDRDEMVILAHHFIFPIARWWWRLTHHTHIYVYLYILKKEEKRTNFFGGNNSWENWWGQIITLVGQ